MKKKIKINNNIITKIMKSNFRDAFHCLHKYHFRSKSFLLTFPPRPDVEHTFYLKHKSKQKQMRTKN